MKKNRTFKNAGTIYKRYKIPVMVMGIAKGEDKGIEEPGVLVHTYNPNTWEAEGL
jgi:hypothetical protein